MIKNHSDSSDDELALLPPSFQHQWADENFSSLIVASIVYTGGEEVDLKKKKKKL